jgi:pimeloyl-ACP methyl ester carboxylesterase
MANKHIVFEGGQINYQVEGRGYPVLLLHGFCEDSQMWEEFKTDLLEEKFKVLRIDMPGFGQSDLLPELSIKKMAEVVNAVIEELNIEKFVFVGHSMGGYVGLAYAEYFAERLNGLCLFHSHPYADTAEKKELRYKSIEFIKRQGHILFVKQLIPNLFTAKFARSNAFLLEKLIFRSTRFAGESIMAAQAAMAERPDRSHVLAGLTIPVQFFIGMEDTAIPKDKSEAQTQLPPLADIHFLNKTAHMGMFEERKLTQRHLRKFVQFCIQQAKSK